MAHSGRTVGPVIKPSKSAAVNRERFKGWSSLPAAPVGTALASLTVVCCISGIAPIALCLLVAALAVTLAGTRSVLASAPAALLAIIAAVTAIDQVHVLGFRPLGDAWTARIVLASMAGLVAVAALARGRGRRVLLAHSGEVAAYIPAVILAATGAWVLTVGATANVWSFLRSGDNANHIRYVTDLIHKGYLSYSTDQVYPRALHAFIAWLQTATVGYPGGDPAETAARTTSAAVWAVYAMLCAATGLLAVRLCRRRSGWVPTVVGAGAGMTMLLSPYFGFAVGYGFQTSVLLALILAVSGLELLTLRAGSVRSLLMASVTLLLSAHTWQLALPALGACWLAAVACAVRKRPASGTRSGWAAAIAVTGGAALASVPAMHAVISQVGVGHAAVSGMAPRLAWEWLVPGLLLAVGLAARFWRSPRQALFACLVLFTAVSAVGLAALLDLSPLAYYPKKLCWQAAALCVPLVWAAAPPVCAAVVRKVPKEGVLRFAVPAAFVAAAGIFAVVAAFTPLTMALAGAR